MLTKEPTANMIQEWKQIYNEYREELKANRKTGEEVNDYFCNKYLPEKYDSPIFYNVVKDNIIENKLYKDRLLHGAIPQIITYKIKGGSVFVGIDLITGFFHVESEDVDRMVEIYDDLFLFRGLGEEDINNYFLVAQYIQCLNKKKA